MSISTLRLRAEIEQLKNSIVAYSEPVYRMFILGIANNPTQAEIDAIHRLILTPTFCYLQGIAV